MIVSYRLAEELPPGPAPKPERCEGCGVFGVFGADEDTGQVVWREIRCTCAVRDLNQGLPRERWCCSLLHTAERCRQIRNNRGPLSPLEIPS